MCWGLPAMRSRVISYVVIMSARSSQPIAVSPVAMHHAAFDLDVVRVAAPDFDIYGLVDDGLVWDTQLLHRLYMLGTEGHTASLKGQSTLEHCASRYLGVSLPKDVQDSHGRNVRTSYGQWLSHPPQEIEPIYLEYLAKDVIATLHVFQRQRHLLHELMSNSAGVFGYVSPQWLGEQVRRWGWQTHHIQLKASIVLRAVTAIGLGVDISRLDELVTQLDGVLTELRQSLRSWGYLPGKRRVHLLLPSGAGPQLHATNFASALPSSLG